MNNLSWILDQINSGCRRLCINFNSLNGDLDALSKAIGRSSSLVRLSVAGSSLGLQQYACLGNAFITNESVQSFYIQRCELQDSGHSVLATSLAKTRAPLRRFVLDSDMLVTRGRGETYVRSNLAAAIMQRPGLQSFDGEYETPQTGPEATDGCFSLLKARLVPGLLPLASRGIYLIQSLACNTCLTELSIDCQYSRSADLMCTGLKYNKTLRVLSLRNPTDASTSVRIAKALPHNHALEELSIQYATIRIDDDAMEAWEHALATNSTLRKLQLVVVRGRIAGMVPLARGIREGAATGALRLESLHIVASQSYQKSLRQPCRDDRDEFYDLANEPMPDSDDPNMTVARGYDSDDSDYSNDGFAILLGQALASPRGCSLKKLQLERCEISRVGIDNLLQCNPTAGSGLRELLLPGCNVGSDGARYIALWLSRPSCVLEKLGLMGSKIRDDGAVALGNALAVNTTLNMLNLSGGKVGSEGGHAIAVGLQSNSTLEDLNLSHNKWALGGQTPVALGKALGENPGIALRRLEILACGLQPESVAPLAAGLARNTTLRELAISVEPTKSLDDESRVLFEAVTHHPTLQYIKVKDELVSAASAPFVARLLAESASLRRLTLDSYSQLPEAAARALLPAIASSTTCKVFNVDIARSSWSEAILEGMQHAAMQSGSMSEMTVGGRTKNHEDMLGMQRHKVVRKWMNQQLETEIAHSSDPGPSTAASIPTTSPKPRVLAGRAVAAMHLAAEGGAVDLTQVAAFVASCMDTIRRSMVRPVGVGEGGRDPGTMAMVSLVLGMGDACQAEYDEVERDRDGVPVVEELPMVRYALRDGGCCDRLRMVERWAIKADYPELAGLCGGTLAGITTDRQSQVLLWRRAVNAKRDAGRVFWAARDGRPLELGKRLRLGRLAGGLEMLGEMEGGAMVGPLEAARLGGHDECVKVLVEALGFA